MVSVAAEWVDKWEGDTGEDGWRERRKTWWRGEKRNKSGERLWGGKTERKRGTGESEAGNETVLRQSWNEKIVTTQHFLSPFNPGAHTHARTHTVNSHCLVSALTGKRRGLRSIWNSDNVVGPLLSSLECFLTARGEKELWRQSATVNRKRC